MKEIYIMLVIDNALLVVVHLINAIVLFPTTDFPLAIGSSAVAIFHIYMTRCYLKKLRE